MKKIIALLLSVMLLLGLVACGNSGTETTAPSNTAATTAPTTEPATEPDAGATTEPQVTYTFDLTAAEPILGSWQYDFEMDCATMFGMAGADLKLPMSMIFTFGEDGTMSVAVDGEKLSANLENFNVQLAAALTDMMYQQFADQGMDKEAADAAMQEKYQMTVEEFSEETARQSFTASSLEESLESSDSLYCVEGNQIYSYAEGAESDAEINTFQVEGDTLTLLDSNQAEMYEALGMAFPLTLTRVAE